ncbi:MAG: phage tail family protein [Leptospiraceae bacterium]|nr:phage tail family protein [Leptospiraceae bacterium]
MKFKFVDSATTPNELDISTLSAAGEKYYPKIESYNPKLNNDTLEKFGKSGSFAIGDNTFKENDFKLNMYILAKTDIQYREKVLNIINFFKPKNAPFFLHIEYDDTTVLSMSVQVKGFPHKYKSEGLEHRISDFSIDLKLLDPFLEDVDYTEETHAGLNSGDTFTVTIADTLCYEAFPVFVITSNGFNPSIVLANDANDGSILLSDSNFNTGSIMTVSSETGEIKLGTNIKANIKQNGYFLKFEQGANEILYQGSNSVDITVRYKKRYLL